MAHFIAIDSLEREILNPSVLLTLINESSNLTAPITYSKLIKLINEFKQDIRYMEFRKSSRFYKKNWKNCA